MHYNQTLLHLQDENDSAFIGLLFVLMALLSEHILQAPAIVFFIEKPLVPAIGKLHSGIGNRNHSVHGEHPSFLFVLEHGHDPGGPGSRFRDGLIDTDYVTLTIDLMNGEVPVLKPGANEISWKGTLTRVVHRPNWRHL